MMHSKRRFRISDVAGAEAASVLARMLTQNTWTGCTGFRLGDYLFLNDSTSPDGAGEFAVIREADGVQVESITFSWCSEEKAAQYITDILAGKYNQSYGKVEVRKHSEGSCHHCA